MMQMEEIIDTNKVLSQNGKILDLFRLYKGVDRSEISRRLQLSMPTIYNAVDSLTTGGMLEKIGSTVSLNKKYGVIIGISIGSSLCKVSFLDFNFDLFSDDDFYNHKMALCQKINQQIENRKLIDICMDDKSRNYVYFNTPTTLSKLKDVLNSIFEYIEICITSNILHVLSIGISCTGIINEKTQTILSSYNLPYLNNVKFDTLILPAKRKFFEENQVLISIIQNSNASVIAEKIHLYKTNSLYKKKENIVSLYLGVGIGAGIYLSKLYSGTNGYCGEISHNRTPSFDSENQVHHQELINENKIDKACNCGRDDCFDYKIRSYVFEKTTEVFSDMSSDDIRDYLADKPDKIKLLSDYLGNIINYITNFLNIDLIIFTGKFYKSMDLLIDHIDIVQDENTMRYSRNDCKIITSDLGSLAPSIGAALYSYYKKLDLELSWNY